MTDQKRPYKMKRRAEQEGETRLRITESAMELHGTVGPARTSICAVAERAGVRRSTVYRHFPDEAALFSACSTHWMALNPPPDLEAWAAIEDPEERFATALGQLYVILATLTFLALGGHIALIEMLVAGLYSLPIGTTGLGQEGLWALILWGGTLFSGAIGIALPGVTALLIVNLAFGVVSRAAPSLNLFAVGFPVSLVVGLLVVLAGIGPLQSSFTELLANGFEFLRSLGGGR